MDKTTTFDILIIYSNKLATSAGDLSPNTTKPFAKGSSSERYNLVYSYFLETCQKNGLKAAFATSADIVGAGKCRNYWLFKNKDWVKIRKCAFSNIIFDKFSPRNKKAKIGRSLLFSSEKVRPFNNPYLFELCFDKQKTYDKLYNFSIPTVTIDGCTRKSINLALKKLKSKIKNHQYKRDFTEGIIMKDRFGAGGINVHRFKANQNSLMVKTMQKHKRISFILQPFISFDKGFIYNNSVAPIDIRLIFLRNKIVQTYIRIAKKGDYRCNEHKGGLLKYISKQQIPSKVLNVSKSITNLLNEKNSLFSLDFIISNTGAVYLLEANAGPGLDWNLSMKKNEIEAKKLINIIIKEITKRANALKENIIVSTDFPITNNYPASPIISTTV